MLIDRRQFLGRVVAAAAVVPTPLAGDERAFRTLILTGGSRRIESGFAVGLNEARRTGDLLGVDWTKAIGAGSGSAVKISALPLPKGAAATVYSVRAAAGTKASVLQAWQRRNPDEAAGVAVEWHPDLQKFGGEQLNARLAAAGQQPDSDMWAGWMAVKIVAEAVARHGGGPVNASTLLGFAFDGHKGTPLRFDAATRHLRQPLCIVSREGHLLATIDPDEGGDS
jgi:hypothetical protein